MKQITVLLLFFSVLNLGFSQTSTANIENFTIGDEAFYTKITTSDSISPGKAGKKVKWNFTKLNTNGNEVKQIIQATGPGNESTNYSMVEANSDSSFVFLKKENDTLYYTAFYDQTRDFLVSYPSGVPFMVYPMSYGQELKTDVTRQYSANNMQFNGTGYFKTTFDGIGELRMPDKTHKDVVRMKFEQVFTDVDNVYGSSMNITTITYAWFDMNTKHSLLKISFKYIRSIYYNQTSCTYSILK